jgi:hypothetical protein
VIAGLATFILFEVGRGPPGLPQQAATVVDPVGPGVAIVSLGLVLARFLTEVYSIFAAVGTIIGGPAPGSVSSGAS